MTGQMLTKTAQTSPADTEWDFNLDFIEESQIMRRLKGLF